ncbi:MAG: DUF2382 domain-containing protein, partial [Alphaproteobacteria bacterium]
MTDPHEIMNPALPEIPDDHGHAPLALNYGPAGGPVDVIRHAEQLRAMTRSVPVERVRLKKVIVTEERTITVQVRREELRLEHETLDPATATPTTVGPSDLELILHGEQITITRTIVPIERVRLTRTQV